MEPTADVTSPEGTSSRMHPEKQRVQTFLNEVQAHAFLQDEEIATARARIASLEQDLSNAKDTLAGRTTDLASLRGQYALERKQDREKTEEIATARARIAALEQDLSSTNDTLVGRTEDLASLRRQYESELKQRGEKSEEMAAEFLRDKFADSLAEVRTQAVTQFNERIRQLEATIADKEVLNARLDEMVKALRQEVDEVKTTAAKDNDSLRQQLISERETFAAEIKKTRAQVTAQFMERIDQLEATLAEKDQLFVRSNEMVESLQAETERVRAAGASEITNRDEAHARERGQYESEKQKLEDKIALLVKQVKEAERIIACSEDLQHVKTLEREREELARQCEAQEQRTEKLLHALTVLHDLCTKSTAVRSILASTRKDLDLNKLFAVLD